MSDLRVTRLRGRTAGSAPNLPDGAVVTGITTSTSFMGSGNDQSILTGSLKITDTTESTSSATGAVIISGGVGIAKSLHVGGNVSVGGTLTYEDVTNVDSIGLITARNGVKVTTGGVDVTAGGVNVTAGGIDIAAGGAKITGNIGLGGANYGTSGQVLTSGGSGSNASWTTISSAPVTELVANGSLTANAGVVVNTSGQVEALSGATAALGSNYAFESQSGDDIDTCKLSDNKYVIAWNAASASNVGKVRVATVSETTVTYGTEVTFESNAVTNIAICRIDDDRFAIFFRTTTLNSNECQIGSVSGTTITLGTAVDMNMSGSSGNGSLAIGYQQDVNCLLMFAASDSNSYKPQVHTARPSGTTVNKASNGWVLVENQDNAHDLNVVENTTDNELLITWISSPQQNGGRSRTLKCSGSSGDHTITWGQNEYISNQNQYQGSVCYNADDNVYLYVFRNQDQSNQLSECCGTPSNSGSNRTISWNSYDNFYTGAGSYPECAYDTTAKKYLLTYANDAGTGSWILYKQNGSSVQSDGSHESFESVIITQNYMQRVITIASGKFAVVYPRSTTNAVSLIRQLVTTNLTAGNFIGFAGDNYTNGQTASIKIVGNTVTGQSGLTPGSKYYVSGDGSLTTTEGTPSVVAGTALSPTKLLIKPQ